MINPGCGSGDWVFDVAFEHPAIEVAGVDISSIMAGYAHRWFKSRHCIDIPLHDCYNGR
jgi:tRNA G46 methylase TrmB